MKNRIRLKLCGSLALPALLLSSGTQAQQLTQYINSFMGVPKYGSVCIGPQLPFGSVTPAPDTPLGGTDGYNPTQKIRGFSQLHVTGTGGASKYGVFLLSPQIGLNVLETGHDSDKAEEEAHPSSYKVRLTEPNILCELAPTHNAVIYRFTYPKSNKAHLLVDLGHSIPGDIAHNGYADKGDVKIDPAAQTIKGWAHYWGGWSGEACVIYFAARYSKKADETATWKDSTINKNSTAETITKARQRIGAVLGFDTKQNEQVFMKIAVSFTSSEKALAFLDKEIPAWDYEKVRTDADAAWNAKMKKIIIEGATDQQRNIFYSSLYNTMREPHDRSGDNPFWPTNKPYWDDQYCIWDTWKTMFPLNIILNESMVRDNVNAFIDRYKHNGQVLDAFIAGNDRVLEMRSDGSNRFLGNQGGDDVDNIITDAFLKKVKGINWNEAYELLKNNAEKQRAPSYRVNDRGWIPYGAHGFGLYCSRTIEFAYNDFCVAQVAKALGKTADYTRYLKRSTGWQNIWNPAAESDGYKGFIAPRAFNGSWLKYDPKTLTSPGLVNFVDPRSFYEGSSWIYSYVLPHDLPKVIKLMGGDDAYNTRLQYALNKGLIEFNNEPSFLTPFSFIYSHRPDLASYWVRENFKNYSETTFPGDDDSGAMGSWYVFACLGFFPNAGQDVYLLNGPMFKKATVTMENGKKIVVEGVNASEENKYIQSARLNGKPLNRPWIKHSEIAGGATLRFVMGPQASAWGKQQTPPVNK